MRAKDVLFVFGAFRNPGKAGLLLAVLLLSVPGEIATLRGDERMSITGYRASEQPIPFVKAVETVEPLTGETDSRARIQAALDRVAGRDPDEKGFRGAVFLSKGAYTVNGSLNLRSGVVLRGEGERGFGTQVIVHNPGGAGITLGGEFSGVEGMSITSGKTTADAESLAESLGVGVEIRNAENVWVRGIRVGQASWTAVSVNDSRQVTVRDSLFEKPVDIRGESGRILVYKNAFGGEEQSDREGERLFEQQLRERLGERQAALVLAETLSKASLPMKLVFPRPVVDGVAQGPVTEEQTAFEAADQRAWKTVMADDGSGDWTEQWFLDGEGSTVTNTPEGMELKAENSHMVLWTKEHFEGDVKIEYEFTRRDVGGGGVIILYIQATGRGDEGFETDIAEWRDSRKGADMSSYFRNMHLYHVSYACGYVRGRRYRPDIRQMNTFSELTPEYLVDQEDFFEVGVPYRITVIKTRREIRVKAVGPEKALYFMLDNEKWPEVTGGRIGLRQMRGRHSRYQNFRVSVPVE